METARTFIALELPDDVRHTLEQMQLTLRATDPGAARAVKWVAPTSIHLTLKFLGATPTDKLPAIEAALQRAAIGSRPFSLHLAEAGCFPNVRQPRVLWIGIGGEVDALKKLQAAVEATISPLGFPSENRPFAAHLTLGRVRDEASSDERLRLGRAIQILKVPLAAFTPHACALMRSNLTPQGAVYTRLAEAPLGTNPETTGRHG